VLLAGVAGLAAGALSMAAGEYVSVSSQSDIECADLAREKTALALNASGEYEELTLIYVQRGLDRMTAESVATQLTAHDALGTHARDELGISELTTARLIQASLTSAATFVVGALAPLVVALLVDTSASPLWVPTTSLPFLALLGAIGALAGGASAWKGALRVLVWGAIAMGVTAAIGRAAGANI